MEGIIIFRQWKRRFFADSGGLGFFSVSLTVIEQVSAKPFDSVAWQP